MSPAEKRRISSPVLLEGLPCGAELAGEKFLAGPQLLFVRPRLVLVHPCSGQFPIGPKASDIKLSLKADRLCLEMQGESGYDRET